MAVQNERAPRCWSSWDGEMPALCTVRPTGGVRNPPESVAATDISSEQAAGGKCASYQSTFRFVDWLELDVRGGIKMVSEPFARMRLSVIYPACGSRGRISFRHVVSTLGVSNPNGSTVYYSYHRGSYSD